MRNPFDRRTTAIKKKHPLYYRWAAIIRGIKDSSSQGYSSYGGKGIDMCYEWKSNYLNFLVWATKNGYHKDLVLCRKDKTKNFEPSNCLFATGSNFGQHSI